jgi:hypothetical protein
MCFRILATCLQLHVCMRQFWLWVLFLLQKQEAKLWYVSMETAKSCGPGSLCGHFERMACFFNGSNLTAWFGWAMHADGSMACPCGMNRSTMAEARTHCAAERVILPRSFSSWSASYMRRSVNPFTWCENIIHQSILTHTHTTHLCKISRKV